MPAAEADGKRPGGAAPREPLSLTYVANEGVLLASGSTKVLIDALFDKPNPEYRAPSPDVLDKISKGEAPFDGVDLALVTHNHPDHLDGAVAARYLSANPGVVLVAPADAVEDVRRASEDWTAIESRVVSLDVEIGKKTRKSPKRIPVTAYRTLHSGNRETPMNLMFAVEVNGWRVFHEGDSTGTVGEYRRFGLDKAPVDLALVHFWFPLSPEQAEFLQGVRSWNHIGLMHLPIRLEGDAPGKIDQVRKYYTDIFLLLPGMTERVFRE